MEIKIRWIRGRKVLLDADLAALYGVTTTKLNEAVKRNLKRFPEDFMFQLTVSELANLRSQFATSSWGGRRWRPWAFTEHGVATVAGFLRSERAIQANIAIIRAFVEMKTLLATKKKLSKEFQRIESWLLAHEDTLGKHSGQIRELLTILEELSGRPSRRIGFAADGETQNE